MVSQVSSVELPSIYISSVCLPSFGKRVMAFSILPLSLRAGITTDTEYSVRLVSGNGFANANWFIQKCLKKGNFAMYLLKRGAISGILKGINILLVLR